MIRPSALGSGPWGWHLASLIGLCCLLSAAQPNAEAAVTQPQIASMEVGFAGAYKVGHWTPIRVTLRGGSARSPGTSLHLIVPDGDGVPTRATRQGDLAAESEQTWTLFTRFGRIHSKLAVMNDAVRPQEIVGRKSAGKPCGGAGRQHMGRSGDIVA